MLGWFFECMVAVGSIRRRSTSRINGVAVTPDRLPALLTDEEFAAMMRDFDTASHWMREQLALKRGTASAAAQKQPSGGESQMAADARPAIDHNHNSTPPHARHSQSGARFHMSTLSPDQHDRYLEVLEAAMRLYSGDHDAAMRWMSHPVKALDGKAPGSMVTTRLEAETVIEFIRRLEHGFVA